MKMRWLVWIGVFCCVLCAQGEMLRGVAQPVTIDVNLTEVQPVLAEPEDAPAPGVEMQIEAVRRVRATGETPRVFLYHSHTYEAYAPTPDAAYAQTEAFRTRDERYNVVRIGAELAQYLREEYRIDVTHDRTAFEPPTLSSAYTRSLRALEDTLARGETYDLYIDLHRDAYSKGARNTVTIDGRTVARVMWLVGKGTGVNNAGEGFAQKPNWPANLALAERLTDTLNARAPELCRAVCVKTGRFNQHVSEGALLLEVGDNGNTLEEALRAIPYLAEAVDTCLRFPAQ